MSDTATLTVSDRLMDILAEQAIVDRSEISPSSTLEDLGIDSVALVEVIFSIEETFDIAVPFNANEAESGEFDISSVGGMIKAVEDLISSRND